VLVAKPFTRMAVDVAVHAEVERCPLARTTLRDGCEPAPSALRPY
jgi:hypothetical protein